MAGLPYNQYLISQKVTKEDDYNRLQFVKYLGWEKRVFRAGALLFPLPGGQPSSPAPHRQGESDVTKDNWQLVKI